MNWFHSSAISEDLRLYLVDKMEASDMHLRKHSFLFEPKTKTLYWRHQIDPLIDPITKQVLHDGLSKGTVGRIDAKYEPELTELSA
jgi:hypothetical protein